MLPREGERVPISYNRRRFAATFVGAVATWSLEAKAQQPARNPTIGLLYTSSTLLGRARVAAFVQRLGELGWAEGRNVTIDLRWAEGRNERAHDTVAEFVQRSVDVIVLNGDAQVLDAKRQTTTIPIVISASADPVGNGLVASLARPGGNVTGLSLGLTETAGKRLELLRELVPSMRRVAIFGNLGNPTVALEHDAVQAAARTLGLDAVRAEIRTASDIGLTFDGLKGRVDALYVCIDPLVGTNGQQINDRALAADLPIMHSFRELVEAGGLVCYGPDVPDMFRRAADMVDKILKGGKPADLPVEQPTKFALVINLKTAKALGIAIPPSTLVRADEVIE
jgi:putative ABC transport system substrate-binding protein